MSCTLARVTSLLARFLLCLLASVALPLEAARAFDHSHAAWNALLRRYVHANPCGSSVDYRGIQEDSGALTTYLRSLESVDAPTFDGFTREQQLAFLINAYNAFAVKQVIDHYPLASIRETGSLLQPFSKKRFFNLFGRKESLEGIERRLADRNYGEPRAFLALSPAARGGPPLRSRAYRADALPAQLEAAARAFMTDSQRNRFSPGDREVRLSPFLLRFRKPLERFAGSIQAFVAPYLGISETERRLIADRRTRVKKLDADWRLNDAAERSDLASAPRGSASRSRSTATRAANPRLACDPA